VPWADHGLPGLQPWVSTGLILALAVRSWQQVGLWRDTISLFSHCIRINSLDPQMFNIRAMAYAELGSYELAVRDLDRAVELAPLDTGYRINRARVLDELGPRAGCHR
jgi:tetratricopeptide (TPR) repeat protein